MAVKILKTCLVILLIIIVAGACFFVFNGFGESKIKLVKVEDIHIPKNLDAEKLFGLFFYNADGSYTRSTQPKEQVNFDEAKPTMIFFHGVQLGIGYKQNETVVNVQGWIDSGYNVASYFWSQMADFMPNICVESVWSNKKIPFNYEKDGKVVTEEKDKLNYSIAECFVAYYADFMSQYDYKGEFIYFQGLSLGSNLLTAVTSCMLALEEADLISTEILPDRVTFHDAYLTNSYSDLYISWLNRPMGTYGTLGMIKDTSILLRKRGIAVEYVASSFVSEMWVLSASGKELYNSFTSQVVLFNFDASYTSNQGLMHTAGKDWYHSVIDCDAYFDNSTEDAEQKGIYAVGPNTPISFTYARMGEVFEMEANTTRYDYSDDIIKSTGIKNAKIAGFAFNDSNNNGVNDDRLYNRVNDITVHLFDGNNKLIATTTTANGGYYEFLIKASDIGKNYYVKIDLPENMQIAKYNIDNNVYTDNGIKSNLQSEVVAINEILDLKIINIGLINK